MPITARLKGKVVNPPKNSDSCVLTISVGQQYHEGEKLEATIKLVGEMFRSVTIVVFGELQRFTKAMHSPSDHDPETLREEAIQDGKAWVARNKNAIDLLREHVDEKGVRHENKLGGIIEFGDCIRERQAEYDSWLELLQGRSTNSLDPFQKAVKGSIAIFVQRCIKANKKMPTEAIANELSRQYVLEECAGLLTWKDRGDLQFQFLIYPGQLNPAVLYLFESVIHSEKPLILQPLAVEFPKQEYKTPLDEMPVAPPAPAARRKISDVHSDGDVSPKPESADGCIEGATKHLAELTADPEPRAAECPNELLSPHAKIQAALYFVRSVGTELPPPLRTELADGLFSYASALRRRPTPKIKSPSTFDYEPKKSDAGTATDTPPVTPADPDSVA